MCSCKKKSVVNTPPPPEFTAQGSGGVSVMVGAQSDIIINSPSLGRVKVKAGKTVPLKYNEARSLKENGAPIWIS